MEQQKEFNVVQGRIVLFKWDEDRYAPSLITQVNEDGSVNLTIFRPDGTTEGKQNVERGNEEGKWAPPGIG